MTLKVVRSSAVFGEFITHQPLSTPSWVPTLGLGGQNHWLPVGTTPHLVGTSQCSYMSAWPNSRNLLAIARVPESPYPFVHCCPFVRERTR